jgi:hypothetical protein
MSLIKQTSLRLYCLKIIAALNKVIISTARRASRWNIQDRFKIWDVYIVSFLVTISCCFYVKPKASEEITLPIFITCTEDTGCMRLRRFTPFQNTRPIRDIRSDSYRNRQFARVFTLTCAHRTIRFRSIQRDLGVSLLPTDADRSKYSSEVCGRWCMMWLHSLKIHPSIIWQSSDGLFCVDDFAASCELGLTWTFRQDMSNGKRCSTKTKKKN